MADAILAQSGIYAIKNKKSNKSYIGSAVHFGKRWSRHKIELRRGTHHSAKLQHAWAKYGADAFEFVVMEIVAQRSDLLTREQYWMDLQNVSVSGYNIRCTAGSMLGQKHSAEAIEKCRAAKVGVIFTAEHKAKLSQWQLGTKQSDETRAKRSATLKGRPRAPEVVAKMGRKNSPETIEKRRAKLIGQKRSPEVIEKFRIASTGRKLSPESIAKRTATQKANRAAKAAVTGI